MCPWAGGGSFALLGRWDVTGVTVGGLAGPDSGDNRQLTAMSPGKMVTDGGPHPGADVPHPFESREPKLLFLSFSFGCQFICPVTGEKGTPRVPRWNKAFGKHLLIAGIFDRLVVFLSLFSGRLCQAGQSRSW